MTRAMRRGLHSMGAALTATLLGGALALSVQAWCGRHHACTVAGL